jgi:hypothetical protein
LNLNLNVQMISSKIYNEGPRLSVVTHRGSRTGIDREDEGKKIEQWVRKSAGPILAFDPQQEKETYHRERKEVLIMDWEESTSVTPHEEDHAILENPTGKVNMLTYFLINCVEIIKDGVVLRTLYDMIDHCIRGRGNHVIQRMVNQVLCRKQTNA